MDISGAEIARSDTISVGSAWPLSYLESSRRCDDVDVMSL
jgi:hypothetical protein